VKSTNVCSAAAATFVAEKFHLRGQSQHSLPTMIGGRLLEVGEVRVERARRVRMKRPERQERLVGAPCSSNEPLSVRF